MTRTCPNCNKKLDKAFCDDCRLSFYMWDDPQPVAQFYRPKKEKRNMTTRFVWKCLAIAIAVVVIGSIVMISEAKVEHDCSLEGIELVGIDVTPIVYEAYSVFKDGDFVRWKEIRSTLMNLTGGAGRYIGVYDVGGSWVLISRVPNGYYIQIGDDWGIGNDNQLHSPRCIMIVEDLPERF